MKRKFRVHIDIVGIHGYINPMKPVLFESLDEAIDEAGKCLVAGLKNGRIEKAGVVNISVNITNVL